MASRLLAGHTPSARAFAVMAIVSATAALIAAGSRARGSEQGDMLTPAEMSSTVGGSIYGCKLVSTGHCNGPDECDACNESQIGDPGVCPRSTAKDYDDWDHKACDTNPMNTLDCATDQEDVFCYIWRQCEGPMSEDTRCNNGECTTVAMGWTCRDCSLGSSLPNWNHYVDTKKCE